MKIGIVGLGKIAHDQHIPSLHASDAFRLAGVANPPPGVTVSEVRALTDLAEVQGVALFASWHS
jgi:predicted dehydrogenase